MDNPIVDIQKLSDSEVTALLLHLVEHSDGLDEDPFDELAEDLA
jgi:hypothetical protein